MSDGFNDESFYNPNPTMHQQNQQAFGFDNDHRHAEIQYGDQFLDFLDAIKTQNYANFSQLLRSNPQFAKRIDVTSRQPPLFYVVQLANQDMALQMIQDLIAQGAEPTYKDPLSQNVMSYVARDGRMKVFDYLVSIGVSPNEIDIYKQTPLFYACREGRLELCKKILDLGANPNHVDMNGQTCLFYSAKMGHLDICKLLVDYGIKHDHVDFKKQTALAWARKSKNQALVDYLQSLKGGHRAPKPEVKPAQKKKGPKAKEEPKNQYKIVFIHNNGAQEDLTEDAFETFKANFPQLADYFMHPEKIPHEETHGNNKEKWQKAAKKIHTSLWKVKGSFIFHEPVDPVKLNCFDYFQIIKNPMDFGTIKTRLNSGYYKKLQEYIDDVNLVFRNCYLYNGTGSEVGKTGVMVDKEFQRLCKENNVEQLLIEEARSENKSEQADHESMLSFPHELMDEEFTGDMFNLDETGS